LAPRARRGPLGLVVLALLLVPASSAPESPPRFGIGFSPARWMPHLAALDPVEIWADAFGDLRGIAVDGQGNVFVADRARGAVTRIAPDGTRTRVASGLDRPVGLAFDPLGRLLIAEERAGRVVRLEPSGRPTVLVSRIKQPRWLATLPDGALFISARRLTRDTDPEPDDESAEPAGILQVTPTGPLRASSPPPRSCRRRPRGAAASAGWRASSSRSRSSPTARPAPLNPSGGLTRSPGPWASRAIAWGPSISRPGSWIFTTTTPGAPSPSSIPWAP